MTQWDWDVIYAMVKKYGFAGPLLDLGGFPDCSFVDYLPPRGNGGGLRRVKGGKGLWSGFASDCRYEHEAEIFAGSHRNEFGTIISTAVLEHVDDPFAFMRSVKELLQDGGLAILTTVFMWMHHGGETDHWRFATPGLTLLARVTGLEVLEVGYHGEAPWIQVYLVCSKGTPSRTPPFTRRSPLGVVQPETEAA